MSLTQLLTSASGYRAEDHRYLPDIPKSPQTWSPGAPFVPLVNPEATESAIAHDYLTQRGGAGVLFWQCTAFPDAPIYTTLVRPGGYLPQFKDAKIITVLLNSWLSAS